MTLPVLSCRYKSSQKEVNWSKVKKPVYLSNRGSKFSDWSATWAGYLISKVSRFLNTVKLYPFLICTQVVFFLRSFNVWFSIQVRHELAGKVFKCCSFIIKHDYKVTIYLLPHILLYMLLGCTPAEQQEVRVSLPVQRSLVWLLLRFSLTRRSFRLKGDGGDAGRADRGRRTRRGRSPGDGLQPIAAQHSDCVQHAVAPHTVEPPHPLRQTQSHR